MGIEEFFENQEIFITGGSGFIGKGLVEKLLRSCPGLGKIYLLMRGKRGKTAHERLLDMLNSILFDRVRSEQPAALQKVYAIEGDCAEIGLALKPEDLEKLKNVSIIYHSAASVRFDDHLRDAILLNTRGTLEMVKLAEKLPHLKVFVHVSTTYCNPQIFEVHEKVYPANADWRTTIKLAETYDQQILNVLTKKYSNYHPNTYTFTKSLAEQIVHEYMHKLPIIILRPSIVISSIIEPVPGWLDNFNGPMGLLVACGVGIMRTSYGNPDAITDFVPVDIVVRCMIIATYYKAKEIQLKSSLMPPKKMEVVNCATGLIRPITIGAVIELGKRLIKENPFEKTLWVPGGSITKCRVWNLIRFIFWHIFTAIFVDTCLQISNRKPFLLKLQRRIFATNLAVHYFSSRTWEFQNDHFHMLHNMVAPEEVDTFGYLQYAQIDYDDLFRNAIRGAKVFLLNEPADSSKGARIRLEIFKFINFLVQFIICLLITRFIINFVNIKLVNFIAFHN